MGTYSSGILALHKDIPMENILLGYDPLPENFSEVCRYEEYILYLFSVGKYYGQGLDNFENMLIKIGPDKYHILIVNEHGVPDSRSAHIEAFGLVLKETSHKDEDNTYTTPYYYVEHLATGTKSEEV